MRGVCSHHLQGHRPEWLLTMFCALDVTSPPLPTYELYSPMLLSHVLSVYSHIHTRVHTPTPPPHRI